MSIGFAGLHAGLVGCGGWGRLILRDLKSLGCRVTVVARSAASVANAAGGGADAVVTTIEDLPDMIDGAVVATQTAQHADAIERLLPRGVPVFTEKALTNSSAAARRIVERAGGRVFVMDKWRYHPGVEAIAAMARSGELGPVLSIRSNRLGWSNGHPDIDAVWILLPHDLSIVYEILGYYPEPEYAVAEWEQDRPVGLTGIFAGSPRVTIAVSARHATAQRSVAVGFRDGAAVLEDGYSASIVVRRTRDGVARKDDVEERRPISTAMPLLAELRAFLEYLQGGPPPRSSAEEGLRAVETVERLRELAGIRT